MRPDRPTRDDVLLAVVTFVWVAAFLTGEVPAVYVVPALAALGVLVLARRPLWGCLVVAAAHLASWPLGVAQESAASLLPVLLVGYSLGRRCRATATVAGAATMLAALVARDLTLPNLAFAGLLLGGAAGFGLLVRRRTAAARAAAAEAAELHDTDPAEVTAAVVAEERLRLADETVAVVRAAVEQMRRLADEAAPTLDPGRISAIQHRGGEAVGDLRRLLGLLREEPVRAPDPPSDDAPRIRRADVVTALVAAAAVVAEATLMEGAAASTFGLALGVGLCAALVLRRAHTTAACLVAAAATAAGLVAAVPPARGLGEVLALALLSWTVGGASARRDWEAWGLLAALTLVSVAGAMPGELALTATILALPALAGRAWGERDREARAADRSATDLRRHIDLRVAEAVTDERLRIARDLHDVSSHAVGVMVLQAGAAGALRGSDPDAARASLGVVAACGADALAELAVLRDVLRAGALGPAAAWPSTTDGVTHSLSSLAQRMRDAGLDLTVDPPEPSLPDDPAVAVTVYRLAQETLTNAAKHAPRARVALSIRQEEDGIVVEVHDDGAVAEPDEPGFGLVGLAERVRGHGGELTAGPRHEGGFAVRARIPLPEQSVPEGAS
jgi:signal transduction histidine kinase